MNAREEIREHLLIRRMKYWLHIARCPLVNVRVPTWRARRISGRFVGDIQIWLSESGSPRPVFFDVSEPHDGTLLPDARWGDNGAAEVGSAPEQFNSCRTHRDR